MSDTAGWASRRLKTPAWTHWAVHTNLFELCIQTLKHKSRVQENGCPRKMQTYTTLTKCIVH